jgi:hypothetical protein
VGAQYRDKIDEALADRERITQALADGVREALKKHKQAVIRLLSGVTGKWSG